MNKENIEDLKSELLFYKQKAILFNEELKEARSKIESAYNAGFEEGWNKCTKKIRNFIIKHCQDYFSIDDEKELELNEKIRKLNNK